MKRWVYGYTVIDGDPGALDVLLRDRLDDLLRTATATPAEPAAVDGSFTLRLGSDVAGVKLGKDVRARCGVAEVIQGRTRIPLAWFAQPGRHAFPSFDGALELEPLSSNHTQLTLAGSYQVPLGPVGAAVDGLALSGVAQHTISTLVRRLGAELETLAAGDEPVSVTVEPPGPTPLRVGDVMTPDPMVFDESLSLRTAALLLVYRGVQGAPVVSETGQLLGVLSEHDLLEKEAAFRPPVGRGARERERRRTAVTVGEACSRPARVTVPDAGLRAAARVMLDHGCARLVVVDGSAIAGIVTRRDILKALLRSDAELQAAVDGLLTTLAEQDLEAHVVWGEVTLGGTISLHSKVPHIVRMISEIDGVVAVHGAPRWREDDVLPGVFGTTVP